MGKKRTPVGLRPLSFGPLADKAHIASEVEKRVVEERDRMATLADSLGIADDTARWYLLALHLAKQHVPELMEVKAIGAPQRWGMMELGVLAVEVERRRDQGSTIEHAACSLAEIEPWRSFVGKKEGYVGNDPGEVLRRNYSRANVEPMAAIARKAFRWHAMQGTVAEWDVGVLELFAEITAARRR